MDSDDLSAQYRARLPLLHELRTSLEEGLHEAVEGLVHVDRVTFRVKEVSSFTRKAASGRYSHPFREIEDQVAGRVLVFFLSDVEPVSEAARTRWTAVEDVRREPERDAEFGYESRHHVFVIPEHEKPEGWVDAGDMPNTFELQIRTLFMHAYAEPQHDFGYKNPSDLPREERRRLSWVAASAWGADQAFEEVRRNVGARS